MSSDGGYFTWLTDEEANVVSEDWGVAVQEVAGQLHHDGQFCQFLQELSGLSRRKRKTDTLLALLLVFLSFDHEVSWALLKENLQ